MPRSASPFTPAFRLPALLLPLLLAGCPDPEAEATKLQQLAAQQVGLSRQAEATSYAQALAHLDTAASAIAQVQRDYPKTQAAQALAQGKAQVGGVSLDSLNKLLRPELQHKAAAEADPLRCAANLAHSMAESHHKVSALMMVAEALERAKQPAEAAPLLDDAIRLAKGFPEGEPGNDEPTRSLQLTLGLQLLAQAGRWAEADALMASDKLQGEAPYLLAAERLLAGEQAKAEALLQRNPFPQGTEAAWGEAAWGYAEGAKLMALVWQVKGKQQEAERWAQRAKRMEPNLPEGSLTFAERQVMRRLSPLERAARMKQSGPLHQLSATELRWRLEAATASAQGEALKALARKEASEAEQLREAAHDPSSQYATDLRESVPKRVFRLSRCAWVLMQLGATQEGQALLSQAKAILAGKTEGGVSAQGLGEEGDSTMGAMYWHDAEAEMVRLKLSSGRPEEALQEAKALLNKLTEHQAEAIPG